MSSMLSDQEVLTTCITRAIENGWEKPSHMNFSSCGDFVVYDVSNNEYQSFKAIDLLFEHSFAKALFGEENVYTVGNGEPLSPGFHALLHPLIPRWQFKLKEIAVAEDRIDYLRKWLESQDREDKKS